MTLSGRNNAPLMIGAVMLVLCVLQLGRGLADNAERVAQQQATDTRTLITVGLFPVDFAPLPGTKEEAIQLQAGLVRSLQEHDDFTLIEPEKMGHWSNVMRMSRIDRKELQVGQLTGAKLLVVPRLIKRGEGYLTHLKLIETATGLTCWENTRHSQDDEPLAVLTEQLLHAIKNAPRPMPDHRVDLAILLPDDPHGRSKKQDWRAEATWHRWSSTFAGRTAAVRILDPHLADFISRGGILRRTGLNDPDRPSQATFDPIIVKPRIESPYDSRFAFEDAPYRLLLTVIDGDWQTQLEAKGTLEHAASIEADLLNRLLALVAERRGIPKPDPIQAVGSASYWRARALIYEAHTSAALEFSGLHDRLQTADGVELIKNVNAAIKSMAGSNEPLAPLGSVSDEHGIYMMGMPQDQPPYSELKKLLHRHYADSHLSGRALMWDVRQVYDYQTRQLKDDNPRGRDRALSIAHKMARAAILGRDVAHPRMIHLLVHAGEGQLAMDAAIAYGWRPYAWQKWQTLSQVVTSAIDTGQMDLAYRAYKAQLTLVPDYFTEREMRHKDRLPRLQDDDAVNNDRWSRLAPGLLEGKERLDKPIRDAKDALSDHYKAIADQENWEQIARESLEDLRTDPPLVTTPTNHSYAPFRSYLLAIKNLLDPQAYEKRLIELAYGGLPEVNGGWDANAEMRRTAWGCRFEAIERLAMLWTVQRRYQDIMDHPLLGTHAWYHGTSNSEWELYLYTGQTQQAIERVESDYDLTLAYLYAGRFEEAAKHPLVDRWGHGVACAKAAVITGDRNTFDRAMQFVNKKNEGKTPLLIQYLQLHMHNIDSMPAWSAGYKAELMRDTDKAIKAYQQGVLDHPNTFAAAEAMFRTGELLLLDKGIEDKARFWLSESVVTYKKLTQQSGDGSVRAWSQYRIGQFAYLMKDDPAAAKKAWQQGASGSGPGKTLCAWALRSLDDPVATVRVGETRNAKAGRIVDIDINAENLGIALDREHPTKQIDSHIFGPIGLDYELFQSWSEDDTADWWMVYLWYRYSDIRPGFALVYVSTPEANQAVWCRMRRGPEVQD